MQVWCGSASASGYRTTISQRSKRLDSPAQARAATGREITVPRRYSAQPTSLFSAKTYQCPHNVDLDAARWPDEMRLSDLEPPLACLSCGKQGSIIVR